VVNASGISANVVTHMFVASGIPAHRATRAISAVPLVGSSRYSSTPASCPATYREVSTDQAPLGSRRNGCPGNARASARTAAIS
jgi:hypothetical protein